MNHRRNSSQKNTLIKPYQRTKYILTEYEFFKQHYNDQVYVSGATELRIISEKTNTTERIPYSKMKNLIPDIMTVGNIEFTYLGHEYSIPPTGDIDDFYHAYMDGFAKGKCRIPDYKFLTSINLVEVNGDNIFLTRFFDKNGLDEFMSSL